MTFHLNGWRFPALLGLLLCALLALTKPSYSGDVAEYTLETIALADHGAPDIRLADVARGKELVPQLTIPYELLEQGMREGSERLYAAFTRGRDGQVFSIHFFGYSALAVLPFKLFEALGMPPFKAFQAVNFAAIFVLGLALRRFFGSPAKAFAGLALFLLCGGMLYLNWTSPECMSAAALLAALLLFTSGAPIAGSLLAGIAAQQNPTILFFFGFAPLLLLVHEYRPGLGLVANLRAVLGPRHLAGLGLGLVLVALPPLFNLYHYGVPNIIVKHFSDPDLISLVRLQSFFFDLNQGMIIGVPAVLAALALWGWKQDGARRNAVLLAACLFFTLALAVPSLAVTNWNSGAAGVMRYAFWSAMPFLFALLLRLRDHARWPRPLVAAVGLAQVVCMANALSYVYVEFSPLARVMLAHAPGLYHPEPEIFAERSGRNDDYLVRSKVYTYTLDGRTVKALVHAANPGADTDLCGAGGALALDNDVTDTTRGWRYIDAPVRCSAERMATRKFQVDQFQARSGIELAAGWSAPQHGGGDWNGVWSDGPRSRLSVVPGGGLRPATLRVAGHYFLGNRRTRVSVNGVDLGWHRLDQEGPLRLPASAAGGGPLEIELEHEAPRAPDGSDRRALGFFLHEVSLRQVPGAAGPAAADAHTVSSR